MIKRLASIIDAAKPITITRGALRAQVAQKQLLEQRAQQCPGSPGYFYLFVWNFKVGSF